ncbi:hypothetical protein [uncultured Allofournierella sp.]|uniref:hypothetical protein n=1 Tax=uncultured Allofournierella sp. TaxID=1940258 RepID=UPI00375326D3
MIKLLKPISFLLCFFCFVPFLYLLPIPSDTQPYAFIMACVFCVVVRKVKIPKIFYNIIWIYILIVVGALVTIILAKPSEKFLVLRKTFNYVSLFVVSTAVYNMLIANNGINEFWEKLFISIWFLVGAIQAYIYPNFMMQFVSNARTGGARGVIGLASEPSFYGYMMIFFFLIASQFKKSKILFQAMCIIQIVLFAKSAVSLIYLAILFACYIIKQMVLIYKQKPEKVIGMIFISMIVVFFVLKFGDDLISVFGNTRMIVLWKNLISNLDSITSIEQLYQLDYSVATRVNSVATAIREFFAYGGIPHGFIYEDFSFRVESGYGTLLYEMGILGVIFIYIISKILYKGFKNNGPIFVCISAMMFSSVQFGNPMLSFILGYGMYNIHLNSQSKRVK